MHGYLNRRDEGQQSCMYLSDNVRLAYIRKAVETEDLNVKPSDFTQERDFIVIKKRGNVLHYYERWLESCWSALFKKPQYKGMSRKQAIDQYMKERFGEIARMSGYRILRYSYSGGILFAEMEKLKAEMVKESNMNAEKTVYIAGMPEAVKDNRARMQELGNMLREGGYGVMGREKLILTSNMRIHISNNPIELYKKSYVQEPGSKPNGLWYAFGTEWINELLITKIPKQKSGYIYEVDINNSNILQIKTNFEINKFTSEYGLSRETSVWSGTYIDWVRVALKYDGIEINLPAGEESPELRWYYGWDVASGCVWNLDKVKIELVGTLKDNVVRVQDYTTKREQKEPWQMTREEFAKTAIPLPDRKDFIKAWLKDNEDIPNLVKPGINYIEQRNGSLLVYGNQRGQAIGIISFRKDAVEHIAVSDRYKGRGIATQLLEESRKYGVRRVIGKVSPEASGIVHRFLVKTAFMEGKPVPPEVLREYPDLMAKAEKQRWRRV